MCTTYITKGNSFSSFSLRSAVLTNPARVTSVHLLLCMLLRCINFGEYSKASTLNNKELDRFEAQVKRDGFSQTADLAFSRGLTVLRFSAGTKSIHAKEPCFDPTFRSRSQRANMRVSRASGNYVYRVTVFPPRVPFPFPLARFSNAYSNRQVYSRHLAFRG